MEKRHLLGAESLDPASMICVNPYEVNPLTDNSTLPLIADIALKVEESNLSLRNQPGTDRGGFYRPQKRIKLEMEEFGDLSPFVTKKRTSTSSIDELNTPIFDNDVFDFDIANYDVQNVHADLHVMLKYDTSFYRHATASKDIFSPYTNNILVAPGNNINNILAAPGNNSNNILATPGTRIIFDYDVNDSASAKIDSSPTRYEDISPGPSQSPYEQIQSSSYQEFSLRSSETSSPDLLMAQKDSSFQDCSAECSEMSSSGVYIVQEFPLENSKTSSSDFGHQVDQKVSMSSNDGSKTSSQDLLMIPLEDSTTCFGHQVIQEGSRPSNIRGFPSERGKRLTLDVSLGDWEGHGGVLDVTTPNLIAEVVNLEETGFNILKLINEDHHPLTDDIFSTPPSAYHTYKNVQQPLKNPHQSRKTPIQSHKNYHQLHKNSYQPHKKIASKQPRKRRPKLEEDDDDDYVPPIKKNRIREYVSSDSESDEEKRPRKKGRGRPPKRTESVSSDCSLGRDGDVSKYRELRDKNNEASRKSRLKRRVKELDLEKESEELRNKNIKLKAQVEELEKMVNNFRDNLFKIMIRK